jgi:uncharacterized membrane protein
VKKLKFVLFSVIIIGSILLNSFSAIAKTHDITLNDIAVDSAVSSGEAIYSIKIKNNDSILHKYTFFLNNLKSGLKGEFIVDNVVKNSIDLKSGESKLIQIKLALQPDIKNLGEIIDINVKRDDGKEADLPISYTIDNAYSLSITNSINNLKVISGGNLNFDIVVKNSGTKGLNNVNLKFDLPNKWIIQNINPEKLGLKAGESSIFKVQIAVPPSEIAGNNKIKVTANSERINSKQIEIPVNIQNNPNLIYIIIGLLVIVATVTLLYFRKNVRR